MKLKLSVFFPICVNWNKTLHELTKFYIHPNLFHTYPVKITKHYT